MTDTPALADDPRWQTLRAAGGLEPLVFDAPDAWPHGPRGSQKTLSVGDDSLSALYCTLQGHRFLRAALPVAIQGAREVLVVEAWGSVSEETYQALMAARMGGAPFEGAFAWLATAVPGFTAPEPVGCNLLPGRPGQLPRLFAQAGPLKDAQQQGLDLDALLALLAAAGRDLGAPLG